MRDMHRHPYQEKTGNLQMDTRTGYQPGLIQGNQSKGWSDRTYPIDGSENGNPRRSTQNKES